MRLRSQDLPPAVYVAGNMYLIRSAVLEAAAKLLPAANCRGSLRSAVRGVRYRHRGRLGCRRSPGKTLRQIAMKTFIIAEAGVNHNGDEKLALALVEAAAKSGADAVKFQTFSADKLTRRAPKRRNIRSRPPARAISTACSRRSKCRRAFTAGCSLTARELGIEFMSTAFDEEALDFLVELGIKRIKVPSGEITNAPLPRHMAGKGLPLIVSTGMAELDEVVAAVDIIRAERAARGFAEPLAEMVTILHCTSNYPTENADVNLRAMNTMARATGLPVGYSDHTLGLAVSTGAVALGATVIEKHFTLDADLPGPDHKASLEPDQLGRAGAADPRRRGGARIRCQGADRVGTSGARSGPAQRYHGSFARRRRDGWQGRCHLDAARYRHFAARPRQGDRAKIGPQHSCGRNPDIGRTLHEPAKGLLHHRNARRFRLDAIDACSASSNPDALELSIIVTGMHLLREYGLTVSEIEAAGLPIARRWPSRRGLRPAR